MNDQEFLARLHANPQDTSPEFLAALQGNAAREALRAELLGLDSLIRQELVAVSAPAGLRQTLLDPARLEAASRHTAANEDSLLRRLLPVAACLVVALGIAWYDQNSRNAELEAEIFAHVYREAAFLERDQALPFSEVNELLETVVGAEFDASNDMQDLQVTYADDCWIARHISFHLIMKGRNGAVSVMMIPNSPVSSEFDISDERFQGLVTPTAGGNLVVIGEKQEPIAEYRNLLSHNLHWEY